MTQGGPSGELSIRMYTLPEAQLLLMQQLHQLDNLVENPASTENEIERQRQFVEVLQACVFRLKAMRLAPGPIR